MPFVPKKQAFNAHINEVVLGVGDKATAIGGQSSATGDDSLAIGNQGLVLGGRAIYTSSEIIQPWLDLHAGRAHVANDPANRTADLVGGMLGREPSFTFL